VDSRVGLQAWPAKLAGLAGLAGCAGQPVDWRPTSWLAILLAGQLVVWLADWPAGWPARQPAVDTQLASWSSSLPARQLASQSASWLAS